MSANPTFTPAAAAQMIGVNSHTIRRWCADHAAHLSANANPAKGFARSLSGRDIEVLRTVAQLRNEGLLTPAVNEKLANLTFAEIDTSQVDAIEQVTFDQPGTLDSPAQAPAAIMVIEAVNAIEARLEARIAAVEAAGKEAKQGQRDAVQWFALGFIAAGVFFLIIVVMAWLYGAR